MTSASEIFQRRRDAFSARIDAYDEYEADDNLRIQAYLRDRLGDVDAIDDRTKQGSLAKAIGVLLDQAGRLDVPDAQALVFFFKRGHGQLSLWGFGPLPEKVIAQPGEELMHSERVDNAVFDELGPIEYTAFDELQYEAYEEEEEYDLESEIDELWELRILRAYAQIEMAFREAFTPQRADALSLILPCLVYVQETGGGIAQHLHTHGT